MNGNTYTPAIEAETIVIEERLQLFFSIYNYQHPSRNNWIQFPSNIFSLFLVHSTLTVHLQMANYSEYEKLGHHQFSLEFYCGEHS